MSDAKQKTTLTFTVTSGAGARTESVTQDIVKIGKDAKSHLKLDDEAASRMHAVIEVASPEDITLIDLGNEPGTLVNGQRINKTKIKAGDEIRIAETRIVLDSAVPAVAGAPAPVATAAAAAPAANPFAAAPVRRRESVRGRGRGQPVRGCGDGEPVRWRGSPAASPFGAPVGEGAFTSTHAHSDD